MSLPNMEAMKEQMATMMEAMMSMRKIMEANAVTFAATSTVAKVNPMPPSGLNQMNHPTLDMHAFPPYGLPPNYTPPNVAYTPNKNVNNSTPIPIESQQPQTDHAHAHEIPRHNLADFEPCLGCATEGQAVGGIPLQNPLEGPQYHPQLHLLHSTTNTLPVFYYGKWWATHLQSFADLVFASERIDVGLKRGKFSHPAWTNEKTGANEEGRMKEKPVLLPTALPMTNTTFSINQNTNQEMNFAARKPVEFTPIPVSYADLLPYLLDNSMVAITLVKVHQPPFLREYDSNATCACHGEAPGHSIEHCRALKRKVQGLIDMSWLKFEENRVDPWVLVPITFRGLYVLACRGLHALAFRGLRVLIFSMLHIHTLREYKFLGHPLILEGDQLCEHIQRGRLSHIYYAYRGKISPVPLQKTSVDHAHQQDHFYMDMDDYHSARRPQCQSPPANVSVGLCRHEIGKDRAHKSPSGPEEVQQGLRVSSSGYGPLSILQGARSPREESHPQRHPVNPEKFNRALGFPALVTGLCSPTGCPFPPARSRHHDIGIAPTRHPMDPKKSNRALGFPALVTGLCQFYGVPVAPSKVIRPPTNRAFIKKYYAPRQA
ncbi:hypothetical protein HKD37_14G040620 [Glycine soja]